MSRRAVGVLVVMVAAVAGALWLPGGEAEGGGPEPIRYDRDACARCRMRISQPGFGGELRDVEGKLHRYDDVGCLLLALWGQHREVPGAWVEDHQGGGFVALTDAFFVLGDPAGTPMGFGVTAFREEAAARAHAARRGGQVGRLEDVLHDTTRFRRTQAKRD